MRVANGPDVIKLAPLAEEAAAFAGGPESVRAAASWALGILELCAAGVVFKPDEELGVAKVDKPVEELIGGAAAAGAFKPGTSRAGGVPTGMVLLAGGIADVALPGVVAPA